MLTAIIILAVAVAALAVNVARFRSTLHQMRLQHDDALMGVEGLRHATEARSAALELRCESVESVVGAHGGVIDDMAVSIGAHRSEVPAIVTDAVAAAIAHMTVPVELIEHDPLEPVPVPAELASEAEVVDAPLTDIAEKARQWQLERADVRTLTIPAGKSRLRLHNDGGAVLQLRLNGDLIELPAIVELDEPGELELTGVMPGLDDAQLTLSAVA